MHKVRLPKVTATSWFGGSIRIFYWNWMKEPWSAQWKTLLGGHMCVSAKTKQELMDKLKPYGTTYVLGR
jgi:hypothetical protein